MDEVIYNLLLKTAQGLTLLGTLRYRLTSTQPAHGGASALPTGADLPALLSHVQQQSTTELFVYQVEGSVTVPLVTGLTPVPIAGIALFALIGPPVTTITSSAEPARNLFFQFNQLDNEHIAGGLVWRPGEPGELIFSALGTQLPLPA